MCHAVGPESRTVTCRLQTGQTNNRPHNLQHVQNCVFNCVCVCSEVVEDVLYAARSPVGGTDKRWLPPLLPQRRTGGASLTDLPHMRLFT